MLLRSISMLTASFLCLAVPSNQTQQVASSGTFNVLSISIAAYGGECDPMDPERNANMMLLGMIMTRFDYGVIHVQEDYKSAYHHTLYQYDRHPFRTTISERFMFDPGLDTLSKYSWGFTFMRVRIDEGVYIDMINLHINDGTGPVDQVTRRWDIQQVTEFIDAKSVGNAVIVFGITNSRYTSCKDNIRRFTDKNGLTDAWVQAIGGNAPAVGADPIVCPKDVVPPDISCEVEDKVFYRGSPIITLKSIGLFYDTERFLTPAGTSLSDRNPVRVEFDTWFNDLPLIPSSPMLSSITLRGGNRLDGLILTLTTGQTFIHGGWGGDPYSLSFASGEYITSVKMCWGKKNGHTRNFYAQATTNKGRTVQAGKTTDHCANATAPSGYGVVGVYGQDGAEMDQLGFIYAQQSPQATLGYTGEMGRGYSTKAGSPRSSGASEENHSCASY